LIPAFAQSAMGQARFFPDRVEGERMATQSLGEGAIR
jgi:hypothetical protein